MKGTNGTIQWEVTETNPAIISVFDTRTQYFNKKEYKCVHEPIGVFDTEDLYKINLILDGMIAEAKEIL